MVTVGAIISPPSYKRGSIWRKWDLHVHAPDTVFNNQFPQTSEGPDWEAYVTRIEALKDIAVIGVTDYFSIDGYKRLRNLQQQGRMSNINLFLPNIEFRLDSLVPTSSSDEAGKVKKINAHIIFSDEVAAEDIEDKFLRQLKFSALGDAQGTNELCALSRYQLEQLGGRIRLQQPTFTGTNYAVGCQNAAVSFQLIKEVLNDQRSSFSGKYLLILATENTSLISWESQGHLLRKVLVQGCDAIFGGQPNDRLWALGLKGHNPKSFAEEFGSLKPCIHGSDAHSLESIGKPAKDRFCWIKADPTFEGLRQVIFEPEDRLFIGDEPPMLKHAYRIIESVAITNAPDWFGYSAIPLSSDLVTIIGGKGAGKSALAELIAYVGGSEFFKSRTGKETKELDDTFLNKASKRTSGNLKPITGAKICIKWMDGEQDEAEITESLFHGKSEEKVKYLPQKFVEQVCAPQNHNELLVEIERVVFQRIPKSDRLGCISFTEVRNLSTKGISVRKTDVKGELEALNSEIYFEFQSAESKAIKAVELAKLQREAVALSKQKPDLSSVSAPDLEKLDGLQVEMRLLETQIASSKQQISVLDELDAVMASVRQKVHGFNGDIKALLEGLEMTAEAESFEIIVPNTIDASLITKRFELNEKIKLLTVGPSDQSTVASIASAISQASEALQFSKTKRIEFEKFEADKLLLDQSILALQKDIEHIQNVVEKSLIIKRERRREKYLDYFEMLKEEKTALERLYLPLRTSLEEGGATDQKLRFVATISFDSSTHAQLGMELFDNRKKPRYRDIDVLLADIKKLMESIQAVDFDRDASRTRIVAFREGFLLDDAKQKLSLGDQLKRNKTEEDFNNWFFNLSRYSVSYSITFEEKDLSLLSPGQKGIVLLLLYLEVDRDDQRPLIIDQPEDNLDNLSVYSNLIKFFRKRKTSRQIILISHNPNLVVNTDSEQIIIASYDGSSNPKITYRTGALEETSFDPPGVREQVCAILEGGTEAFQKREMKYSLL